MALGYSSLTRNQSLDPLFPLPSARRGGDSRRPPVAAIRSGRSSTARCGRPPRPPVAARPGADLSPSAPSPLRGARPRRPRASIRPSAARPGRAWRRLAPSPPPVVDAAPRLHLLRLQPLPLLLRSWLWCPSPVSNLLRS